MQKIINNLNNTKADILNTLKKCDRQENEVRLLAVSKTVGLDEVKIAIEQGQHDFGENRVLELNKKAAAFPDENWHFIGRIQTNKIKDIVGVACLIHSVASVRALEKINACASKLGIIQDVLIEVNVSGEQSKDGFVPSEIKEALERCKSYSNLKVCGFMTMAPQGDLNLARSVFRRLHEISEEFKVLYSGVDNIDLCELSMGMSQDYHEAIEQGATIVRLGHSIFA